MLQLAERTEGTVIAIELEGVPLSVEGVERGIAIVQTGIDQAGTGENEGASLHRADIRQATGGPGRAIAGAGAWRVQGCAGWLMTRKRLSSLSERRIRIVEPWEESLSPSLSAETPEPAVSIVSWAGSRSWTSSVVVPSFA